MCALLRDEYRSVTLPGERPPRTLPPARTADQKLLQTVTLLCADAGPLNARGEAELSEKMLAAHQDTHSKVKNRAVDQQILEEVVRANRPQTADVLITQCGILQGVRLNMLTKALLNRASEAMLRVLEKHQKSIKTEPQASMLMSIIAADDVEIYDMAVKRYNLKPGLEAVQIALAHSEERGLQMWYPKILPHVDESVKKKVLDDSFMGRIRRNHHLYNLATVLDRLLEDGFALSVSTVQNYAHAVWNFPKHPMHTLCTKLKKRKRDELYR